LDPHLQRIAELANPGVLHLEVALEAAGKAGRDCADGKQSHGSAGGQGYFGLQKPYILR